MKTYPVFRVGYAESAKSSTLEDPFLVAVELDHPAYRGAGEGIRIAEMKNETRILYGERTTASLQEPVLHFLDHIQFRPAETIWIRDLPAALGLVAGRPAEADG